MIDKNYTTQEVADICRVKRETVQEWIRDKKIVAVKFGRSYLITETDLKNYLESKHG